MKDSMKESHLGSVEAVKEESARILRAIPEIEWARCFESWKKRIRRCIAASGDYFEGDRIFNC